MEITPATSAPERTVFRLKHSDKAVECSAASLLLSPFSNNPSQLWSKFQGVNGQCFINRGTGAYLGVENGAVQTKIQAAYEWNVQEQGAFVRLETPQKALLRITQQKIELSPNTDADTLFVIDDVPSPTLSVGSEDYVHSPEHICVTNYMFNAINAINAIIRILGNPDKDPLPNLDVMVLRYTSEHFAQFKARGNEAIQNFDFASATVAAWFTSIGSKMEAEQMTGGELTRANMLQEAKHNAAVSELQQLTATHQATMARVQTQQAKYDSAEREYKNALAVHNSALTDEREESKPLGPPPGLFGGSTALFYKANNYRLQKNRENAQEKLDSRNHECIEAWELLTPLKAESMREDNEMAKLRGEIYIAHRVAGNNDVKLAQLKAHQDTLINLQESIKDCRTHLANALQHNVTDGSSLTMVRQRVKGIVQVLQKDDDFREPLEILDVAALGQLGKMIPGVSQHEVAW